MSKVKIEGHGTGTGTFTVTTPSSNTDRTITLPDATGTLATTADSVGGANGVDFNDNVKARFGTGNDLEIFHDGSHTYIQDVGTGNLRIRGQQIEMYNPDGSESIADFNVDGAATLYHNGSAKFATSATGITVTGTLTQSGNKTQIFAGQYDGTTTGTTTLGSLGFKPMALWCLFKVNNASVASWGFAGRQGGQSVLYDNKIHNSSTHWASDSSYIGRLRFGSSNDVNLAVTTWNDDEIVLTRSKGGSGNSSAAAYKILVMG